MVKKHKRSNGTIQNRQAKFNYNIEDTYIVGIVLNGAETKALRMGYVQLTGSYATIKNGELFLVNTLISGSNQIRITEHQQTRDRKLLAKKREITAMLEAKQQGRTIVPLELLTRGRYIKLKLAVGQGKKRYDKRQTLKARSEQRQIDNAMKDR